MRYYTAILYHICHSFHSVFRVYFLSVFSGRAHFSSFQSYVEFLVGRDGEFDQIVSSAVLRYKKRSDAGNCSLTWVMPYMKSEYAHNRKNTTAIMIRSRSVSNPLWLTRNQPYKSATELLLTVPICVCFTFAKRWAALIRR